MGDRSAMTPLIVDLRCLQAPETAGRGIGHHCRSMLAAMPAPLRASWRLVGLLDPALPPPASTDIRLCDAIATESYRLARAGGVFLNPAPMVFASARIMPLLHDAALRRVAVIHDFIPADMPELYLADAQRRQDYDEARALLPRYHRFLVNSRTVAKRAAAIVGCAASAVTVTGVAIRRSLLPDAPPPDFGSRDIVLVVGGDDPRKNPEVAVRAHGALEGLQAARLALWLLGVPDLAERDRLAGLHREAGGNPALLRFLPPLSDADLAAAYRRARVMIAPSRAEGFSMPIVEALANGAAVLASEEPAQAELVPASSDRFGADDATALAALLRCVALHPRAWDAVIDRQIQLWPNFTEARVAERFWAAIGAPPVAAPAIGRKAKPRLALLSPLPPTPSGCADHSAALLAALAGRAEVTAFSATAAPVLQPGIRFGGPPEPGAVAAAGPDAVVAVLGNSPLHRAETNHLLTCGAAAILHDARLLDFYRATFGDRRAAAVAGFELGRDVGREELEAWRLDQSAMPVRCLGEVAAAAAPLIVHARETAQFVAARHGVDPVFLPFAPYRSLDPALLTEEGRAAARARLGIAPGEVLIASFGHVNRDKCPGRLIEAVAALGRRPRPCLAFAGSGDAVVLDALRTQAASLGLPAGAVRLSDAQLPESAYADHLAAADIAVQLRRAPPGSISGALMDAIVAGLPSVASRTLVEALEPPASVVPVADDASAEEIAAAIDQALALDRAAARAASETVLCARGMDRYAARLLQAALQ